LKRILAKYESGTMVLIKYTEQASLALIQIVSE